MFYFLVSVAVVAFSSYGSAVVIIRLHLFLFVLFINAPPNWAHQQVPDSIRLKFQFQLVCVCLLHFICSVFTCALIDCKFTTALFGVSSVCVFLSDWCGEYV